MTTHTNDLIDFWARANGAFVHPADQEHIRPGDFATGLHPVPWVGPLSARVFVLFLNPGLAPEDKRYEEENPEFVQALRNNLGGLSPYLYMQNRFSGHSGYGWARQTFGADLGERHSEMFCVLQLVPYHSCKGAAARKIAEQLPSSKRIRRFAQESLLPRAQKGEIGLVVARSWKLWQLPKEPEIPNVVIYERSEPRRAFQTRNSRGGKLLRQMLNLPTGE